MKSNITPIDPTLKAFRKGRTAVNTFAGINVYSTRAAPSNSLVKLWELESMFPTVSPMAGKIKLLDKKPPSGIKWIAADSNIGYDHGKPEGAHTSTVKLKSGGNFVTGGVITRRLTIKGLSPGGNVPKQFKGLSVASGGCVDATEAFSKAILDNVGDKIQEKHDRFAKTILKGSGKRTKAKGLLGGMYKHTLHSKKYKPRYNAPIMPGMLRRVCGHLLELANSHPAFDPLHSIIHKVCDLNVGSLPFVNDDSIDQTVRSLDLVRLEDPSAPTDAMARGLCAPEPFHYTTTIHHDDNVNTNGAHVVVEYEKTLSRVLRYRRHFASTYSSTSQRESLYLSCLNITLNFLHDKLGFMDTGVRFSSMLAPLTVLFYVDLEREDPIKVASCICHVIKHAMLADFNKWYYNDPLFKTVFALPLHYETITLTMFEVEYGQKIETHNLHATIKPFTKGAKGSGLADTVQLIRYKPSDVAPNVLVQDY